MDLKYIYIHIGPARGHSLKFQNHTRIKRNLGHRLKISSIGHKKLLHSIPHQILPHVDVNNISLAQRLTKWHISMSMWPPILAQCAVLALLLLFIWYGTYRVSQNIGNNKDDIIFYILNGCLQIFLQGSHVMCIWRKISGQPTF